MHKNSLVTAFFVIAAEIIVGTMAVIIYLSFLLIISQNFLSEFDSSIIQWVYSFRSDLLTNVMKTVTFFGGEIFLICGIVFLLVVIWSRHKITAFNFAVLLVFGTVINLLLKIVFHRQRPDLLPLVHESTYSFPSGHSMNSFIFYSCVVYFVCRNTKSKLLRICTVSFFGMLVLLIGVSRIYLGAHYPSDVLAGYIAGVLWFILIVLVEKTAHRFKLFKKVL